MATDFELDDEEGDVTYTSFYRCDDCDVEWDSEWSCACNDECPECGAEIEPYDYETDDIPARSGGTAQ